MVSGRRLRCLAGLLLVAGSVCAEAQGTFSLTRGYVGNVDQDGQVSFGLTFNQAPDFFTLDPAGRPAVSFQFYIASSTNVPIDWPPRPYASLIRGEEINVQGNLRVRDDGPWDAGDPDSGGWGALRGAVGYSLAGDTLTFSVPASMLNVSGPFAYALDLFNYGASAQLPYTGLSGGPILVPEPRFWVCLALSGVLGWLARAQRPRSR